VKNRYAEAEAKVRDAARVAEIRADAASKVQRDFAPIRERAAANAAEMNSLRGLRAAW
jgi:hypothetical protein